MPPRALRRARPGSAATTATLVGAGDIAGCDWDDDEATAALLDRIEGTVFTAGDNVYPAGTTDTYADCFGPTWGRHLDRLRPAPGNHDWELGTLDAYAAYFGDAARNEVGDPWYAYQLGSWQVVVLDSDCSHVGGCGPDSVQGRWLAETLAASDAVCTLAIWHHPRFSSGTHGSDPTVARSGMPCTRPTPTSWSTGTSTTTNGSRRRTRVERWIASAGCASSSSAPAAPTCATSRHRSPNSELRLAVGHGVIEFTLGDGGYEWQWLPAGARSPTAGRRAATDPGSGRS